MERSRNGGTRIVGEVIPMRPSGNSQPPTIESSALAQFRSNVGLVHASDQFDYDGHSEYHAATLPDGTVQAGAVGLDSFTNIFGEIEINAPCYSREEVIQALFSDNDAERKESDYLDASKLYAGYYIASICLKELRIVDADFHDAIGGLASRQFYRKTGGALQAMGLGEEHEVEDYLIGKFSASFASQFATRKLQNEVKLAVHKRATDARPRVSLTDDEREITRHFSNEKIFVNAASGHEAPATAVMRLLSEQYPV